VHASGAAEDGHTAAVGGNDKGEISAVRSLLSELKSGRMLVLGAFVALVVFAFPGSARAERPGWYANPSLAGEPRVGATLTLNQGGIKCDNCLGTAVQWYACTGPGNAGADRPTGGLPFDAVQAPGCEVRVPFPGSNNYTVQQADVNKHIQAEIVAENHDCGEVNHSTGTQECRNSRGHAYSNTVGPIAAAAPAAPAAPPAPAAVVPLFTAQPSISGQPALGQTLTANNGTVTGTQPINFRYQWFRCSSALRGCQAIEGATQARYTVVEADVGARITVTVTATNAGGGRAATAPLTAAVRRAGSAPATAAPAGAARVVRAQDLAASERLTLDRVTAPATVRAGATAVVRVRVTDRRGFLVRGAIIDVLGRPGEVEPAAATRTGARGTAAVRVRIGALSSARSILIAVVASKPQDTAPAVKAVTLRVQP
jgi:hypothetical protein